VTPRLAASLLAATLVIAGCSSSDDDAASDASATTSATTSDDSASTTADETPASSTAPMSTIASSTDTSVAPSTSTSTPPTTEAPAATSTTVADDESADADFTDAEQADRAAARTALITLSVFPDGWVEDPVEDDEADPSADAFQAEFDACLGRDDVQVGDELDRLKVSTGEFHPVDDDATTVSHEVVLAPDVDTALAAMAEVRVDGAEECLAAVIQEFYVTSFADDPDLAEVGIGDVIVTRTESDRDPNLAVGVMLEVPLTIGDQTVSQFLELLYQRQGRALSELSFSAFGAPFNRDGYTVLSDEAIIRIATIGN
jgi:hypothetical protein